MAWDLPGRWSVDYQWRLLECGSAARSISGRQHMHQRDGRDPMRGSLVPSGRRSHPQAVAPMTLARRADTTRAPVADRTQSPAYRIVCGDAFESDVTFDAWFSAQTARPDRIRFARLGDVARSAATLVAAVTAGRNGVATAAVLVHENLKGSGAPGRTAGALEAVRTLRDRLGPVAMPPCILITARAHPPEIHRFRLAGGAHAIDCATQTVAARCAVLAAAIRGERWRHAPCPPRVAFTPRDIDLLPLLAADLSAHEIARSLGITSAQVHDARRALYRRLDTAGAVDFVLSGQTTALATAALRAGAIWVPLSHD
jgi:DNA-binding NarL/FixJ family response regulator